MTKKKLQSIRIDSSIVDRIENIARANPFYNKSSIINLVLLALCENLDDWNIMLLVRHAINWKSRPRLKISIDLIEPGK